MAGSENEYELKDCVKGLKELGKPGFLQVVYDDKKICSRAKTCTIPCEHRKK